MNHQTPRPSAVGALGNDPSETAAPLIGSAAEPQQQSGDGEPVGSIAKAKETAGPKAPTMSKAVALIRKLKSTTGTTIETMMRMTGWQAHSVRGFLSAIVRKKLGHPIASEVGKDGVRRYRIIAARKER